MTKKLSIIALFLPLLGWNQSLENLLKSAKLSEPTEVLMEFTEKEKSHFATAFLIYFTLVIFAIFLRQKKLVKY